ncbi:MAG TPA: DUF6316 family protein [Gammaproteobacteria bacterium]|nr:DUF6316 family protein [Gammaproteobacteria bacterium]
MIRNRQGETGSTPFRNGRLRCIDNQWFVATRGPALHGPYPSQEAAEKALDEHIGNRSRER